MQDDMELPVVRSLLVKYDGRLVGTLAETTEGVVAFEYDRSWLGDGFPISPLSLPLRSGVFLPGFQPFEGLFGVFSDSLPDGWGRYVLDRMLQRHGVKVDALSQLQRLAVVGSSGMGALSYEPELDLSVASQELDLDALAAECKSLIDTREAADVDELFLLGGSSGGARPKVLVESEGEDWIVKFPASMDQADIGVMEYDYAQAAQACGIEMPEVRLFDSKTGPGYFGVRRFDRLRSEDGSIHKRHMISASALLETSHRVPSLDYQALATLTLRLTDDFSELQKLYRLMCFNVLAHNRDDHSRNFSFLYDDDTQRYRLSPAYDLTYSVGMGGEHATTVNGKGRGITEEDLFDAGRAFGLDTKICSKIIDTVATVAVPLVRKWSGSVRV
jgi:serine/threonine-protein kinase HipA